MASETMKARIESGVGEAWILILVGIRGRQLPINVGTNATEFSQPMALEA